MYFDKPVNELTVAEAAYLAALPKAPSTLHPVKNRDRAIERRDDVIDRLLENGWVNQADAEKARKQPLIVTSRTNLAHTFAGEYFARRYGATCSSAMAKRSSTKGGCRSG